MPVRRARRHARSEPLVAPRRPGPALRVPVIASAVVLFAASLWGCVGRDHPVPFGPPSSATVPTVPVPVASGVPAPTEGTYLGAFVNPSGVRSGGTMEVVASHLPELTQTIGRNLAIVSSYQPWGSHWVRNDQMAEVADTYGSIPMISWHCGSLDETVAAGGDDELIRRFARQLRDYRRPVLLRWFWEANLPAWETCHGQLTGPGRASSYVAAYRRIVDLFRAEGAANVAFVWAPSVSPLAPRTDDYYPGDDYVDWIGGDGYDRTDTGFADIFGSWYERYAGHGKPMMVAETGSTADQASFLADVGAVVPSAFPQVKAIVYFDAVGTYMDWRLASYGGAGLPAFAALGQNPHFAAMPPR